jgi:hypothetical protein
VKIKVRNLGQIKQAILELRPITLLIGVNNTNKSWTAYTAYTLLRALRTHQFGEQVRPRIITRRIREQVKKLSSEAANRIASVPDEAAITLPFSRSSIIEFVGNELSLGISGNQLSEVLAAPSEVINNASASLTIPRNDLKYGGEYFFISLANDGALYYGKTNKPTSPRFKISRDNLGGFFEKFDPQSLTAEFIQRREINWEQRIESLLLDFVLGILEDVWALPAERKALVTLYKGLTDETRSQLPLPLRHFVANLKSAENRARDTGERSAAMNVKPKVYSKLEHILGGRVEFESAPIGQRLVFSAANHITLPMQAASSMVRSLSGLALAIQNFYGSRNVLVIDEPEMNAHPSAQLGLVELLGALANQGNFVIATTHSPYVIEHFNNLIAAGELQGASRKRAAGKFTLNMEESFLNWDMVSAYELSPKGEVTDLMDLDRQRISTNTFGDVSSQLENLYSQLLEMKQS